LSGDLGHAVPAGDHRHAETPTAVGAEERFGRCPLVRGQLIGDHRLDRRPAQDPFAAEATVVQEHLPERQIVIRGGHQAASA